MTKLRRTLTAAVLMTIAGTAQASETETTMADHPYVGMWVTEDGHVRQELLPNGRYDEARGTRQSAYTGRYEIDGNQIQYWDDTGFTADGTFVDGVLHHGGMIMYREETAR
ncbi:Atu4866 domain-containing protein [Acuticoccus sediminis]|uniref:Atu4866 domain-containing protein n=1 Tax=Acuticoccus sediminis TaxID=2184697 RepID=UPI00384BDFC2